MGCIGDGSGEGSGEGSGDGIVVVTDGELVILSIHKRVSGKLLYVIDDTVTSHLHFSVVLAMATLETVALQLNIASQIFPTEILKSKK